MLMTPEGSRRHPARMGFRRSRNISSCYVKSGKLAAIGTNCGGAKATLRAQQGQPSAQIAVKISKFSFTLISGRSGPYRALMFADCACAKQMLRLHRFSMRAGAAGTGCPGTEGIWRAPVRTSMRGNPHLGMTSRVCGGGKSRRMAGERPRVIARAGSCAVFPSACPLAYKRRQIP